MKKLGTLLSTVAALLLLAGVPQPSHAQYAPSAPSFLSDVAGRFVASNYNYPVTANYVGGPGGGNGGNSVGASSITVQTANIVLPDGRQIFPYNIFTPIIVGNGSVQEYLLPTGVSNCNYNSSTGNGSCTISGTFTFAHSNGEPVISGTAGLAEAMYDAFNMGGGLVEVDRAWRNGLNTSCSGCPATALAALSSSIPFATVVIEDVIGGFARYYTVQPTTLTALATPATRSASASGCTATHFVCDGTAVGTWTNAATYVCVTYVDILGGESPCSTTSNYTSAGSLAINFTAPVASTGAVGWRAYAGASYATAYQLPITSANCTLTTLETILPACAVTNAVYGQTGSNGVFPTPTTHTQIPPQAGGVAAQYNPNTQSHNAFGYIPGPRLGYLFQQNYGPFVASGALTGGQSVVLGTVPLPALFLNAIFTTLHLSGNVTLTPSTGGTIQLLAAIGDITDFSTGTPKTICTLTETTATGTAAIKVHFDCTWTVNAVGTTGSIMPGGFMLEQLQAGTTTGNLGVESATAAITADVQDQDSIFIEFLQTTAAESTTPPQLLDLHVEVL